MEDKKLTKEEFEIMYISLPEEDRKTPAITIDGESYSINVIKIEVDANTKLGDLMLETLGEIIN